MVAILFAPASVAAGCLQVAAGIWVDPDVAPGRRDNDGPDASQLVGILDRRAVRIEIAPTSSDSPPPYARDIVKGVA
jgi:hypothetical protein